MAEDFSSQAVADPPDFSAAADAPDFSAGSDEPASQGLPAIDRTYLSRLYPVMRQLLQEQPSAFPFRRAGETPPQSEMSLSEALRQPPLSEAEAARWNTDMLGALKKAADERLQESGFRRVARGAREALFEVSEGIQSPLGAALVAGTVAAGVLGPEIPFLVAASFGTKQAATSVGVLTVPGQSPEEYAKQAVLGTGAALLPKAAGRVSRTPLTEGAVAQTVKALAAEETALAGRLDVKAAAEAAPEPPAPRTETAGNLAASAEVGAPVSLPSTQLLPDMLPRADSKAAFLQKFGAGRIPFIGRFFDPAAKPLTPVGEALQTYFGERYGVGPAMASRFGNLIRGLDEPFKVDPKTGDITNIAAREGQSRKISDVLEELQRDPDAYPLTVEQRAAVDRIASIERHFKELEGRYGIGRSADDEGLPPDEAGALADLPANAPYFPRIVIERPSAPPASTGGQAVGGRQFFERPRLFDTEAGGWAKGYRYEPSIERRLVTRAERLYKKIADKRLADDPALTAPPALRAMNRAELEGQLAVEFAEELASGSMTPEKLSNIADSIQRRGTAYQPAFGQRIFTPEVADALNTGLAHHTSHLRQMFVKLNNAAKTLFLGFDVGNLFIQLLLTLYKNPDVWAKLSWESMRSLASDDAFPAFVRDHAESTRQLAELGSPVGKLPEFLAGFGKGELITRIPGVGPVAEAFGRQFRAGLDVAKIHLWEAYRDALPRSEWMDAVRGIEAQLLGGRMESAGVTPNRALTERAFFLAPSYYRGALDLIGNLSHRGVSGQIARRSMGAYLAAGSALYYGVGQALVQNGHMTEAELRERFNPGHPAFMMWKVRFGDKPVNVGFGGIYKSLTKLAAASIKTSVEHPENWASLDPQENPIVRWLRGHSAPLPSLAFDQFTGRDFLGRDVDVGAVAPRLLPLAVQAVLRKEGEPPPSPAEAVFSLLGLSAYGEPIQRQYETERERLARANHGQSYEDLSLAQQARLTRDLAKDGRFHRPPPSSLQTERAIRATLDRARRLRDSLSRDNRALLDELGLQVRGYAPSLTVGGVRLSLTDAQRERYEAAIAAEYETIISRNADKLRKVNPADRQPLLDELLEAARQKARAAIPPRKE